MRRGRGRGGGHRGGAYHRACDSRIPLLRDAEFVTADFVDTCGRIRRTWSALVARRTGASLGGARRPWSARSGGACADALRARRRSSGRGSRPNPPVDRVDFEEHAALGRRAARAGRPPRRPLLRRRDRAARGRAARGVAPLADGDRAAVHAVALGTTPPSTRSRARAGRCGRPAPATTPRRSSARSSRYVGSDFDPPSPLAPDLEQGARALAGRARAVGGGDPARTRCGRPRRSRRSSSRERTTPRSTRSATRSSGSSTPSGRSCPGTATRRSSTRGSTRRCSRSSRARRPGSARARPAALSRRGARPLCRRAGRGRRAVLRTAAQARVRELDDLEQVDDVDRERERDERRSRRTATRLPQVPLPALAERDEARRERGRRRGSRPEPTSSRPRAAARSRC